MRHPTRLACIAALSAALPVSTLAQDADFPDCKISLVPIPITYAGAYKYPSVEASINGKPTLAAIDISAAHTTLNKKVLDRMGIRSSRMGKVSGLGGSSTAYSATLEEIAVGPAKGNGTFYAFDSSIADYGVQLGSDYLLRMNVELSLAEHTLRFVLAKDCGKANLAYWEGVSTSIPYTDYSAADLRPEFTITVDGKKLTAMLSTTIRNSVIDVTAASRLPGKTSSTFSGAGTLKAQGPDGKPIPVWIGQFNQIDIGGEKISNPKLNVMSLAGIKADVILGMDYLWSHRILISPSQQRIYFTYIGGALFRTNDFDVDWLTAQANEGNTYAMYRLAMSIQHSAGGDEFPPAAITWYRKAAALGHPMAHQRLALHEYRLGNMAASAAAFREAFRLQPPSWSQVAMWYAAAAKSGDRAAALKELGALRSQVTDGDGFGGHILDFHLDKISREQLFKYATEGQAQPAVRLCEANYQLGQYLLIAGQKDAARAAFEKARDTCPESEGEGDMARFELGALERAAK